MISTRRRRWAEMLLSLGLCLMAVTAVAWAEEPGVEPTPVPVATETPTPTPEPTLTPEPTPAVTETATPTATATAIETAVATETVTPTPTPTPTPMATPARAPAPAAVAPAQAPAPTPTPTPTATPTGALLTICSYDPADGSYSPVVIPADQYSPYFDDEFAIIPAPPEGCDSVAADPDEAARAETTICHVTGDPARPFELVTLPTGDLGGHELHPGDLIPAPNRTCPGLAYAVPSATPTATPTRTAAPTAVPTATAEPQDETSGGGRPIANVLDDLAGSAPAATTAQSGASSLPFTGADVWVLFAVGFGFVLMGAGLRLLAVPSHPLA
jgi:hypothetical protein